MVRLSLPGFNPDNYSATQPPPLTPEDHKDKFNLLRRIIVLLFIILLFAILLGLAWYLVENGYLSSVG